MAEKETAIDKGKEPASNVNGAVVHTTNGYDSIFTNGQDQSDLNNGQVGNFAPIRNDAETQKIPKMSSKRMFELASSPEFLPKTNAAGSVEEALVFEEDARTNGVEGRDHHDGLSGNGPLQRRTVDQESTDTGVLRSAPLHDARFCIPVSRARKEAKSDSSRQAIPRTVSTPPLSRDSLGIKEYSFPARRLAPLPLRSQEQEKGELPISSNKPERRNTITDDSMPSPMPQSFPTPPPSIPTYLELELSSQRPSPLYLHHSITCDFPYESSRIKLERLQNFLLLPVYLEPSLWFGALACMDAWLYSFTILPLRFTKAVWILSQSWGINFVREAKYLTDFNYKGIGRLWRRRRGSSLSKSYSKNFIHDTSVEDDKHPSRTLRARFNRSASRSQNGHYSMPAPPSTRTKHRRTQSTPSALLPTHKADILNFLLIVISCAILGRFDASRMYHSIRGQAAIKLYVIYNVLEVCDRLFSAIGQDVLECLFSKECLERKENGRSKLWRPFWLFCLALFYNLVHAMALFYQVITLNVAVNSYSNALLTLLMSNQFVEIKSTVFKKFEKDNLFQLTCADIVERFQLWLMLTIIAARNVIETGGLSLPLSDDLSSGPSSSATILPFSFTLLSDYSLKLLTPFLLVLGSEALVDNLKHAYITKFNNTRPAIYGRFLDLLAKDYYSNAFSPDQRDLTRRLGLPTIPLACLGIRASVQTYRMFLATHLPPPSPSPSTSLLASPDASPSPSTLASILRLALGHSSFGSATASPDAAPLMSFRYWTSFTSDDLISLATMAGVFAILFSLLLLFKLLLGMALLEYARRRYKGMKERENMDVDTKGKRVGGWGVVEVSDEKRRWIYKGEEDGWKARGSETGTNATQDDEGIETHNNAKISKSKAKDDWSNVRRYDMVAKRIW